MREFQRSVSNTVLSDLIGEAQVSNAGLARRVNQLGRSAHGLDLRYDASSVHRWLRGASPAHPAPLLIANVLAARLGRPVSPELLFTDARHDFLKMPDTVAAAVETATALWRLPVHRRDNTAETLSSAASVQAGWRWTFDPSASAPSRSGLVSVGTADVERLRSDRQSFADLDSRHGGGYALALLADYLTRQVGPLLHGSYTGSVGRLLLSAAADLTQAMSYMLFDAGALALGQRYAIQALALAKEAGDVVFGAYVMSNLANQHIFLRDGRTAAQLARAATSAVARRAPGALLAQLATTEARGHALAGDPRACLTAIKRAEWLLGRTRRDDIPGWLGAGSAAHRHGAIMHCLLDLGEYEAAAEYSGPALDLPGSSVRATALHQISAASVHARLGDFGRALHLATPAVRAAATLRSARLVSRCSDFMSQLSVFEQLPEVRGWLDGARAVCAPRAH